VLGPPGPEDRAQLQAFTRVRLAHARKTGGLSAMRERLLETGGESAMDALSGDLDPADLAALRESLAWFRPKYRAVWKDGRVARAFLEAAERDRAATELDLLLARIAAFYGVRPDAAAAPRLLLVPVPDGYGTHAFALRRTLVLEIRPGDRLADQAAVIVHENAHFLFGRVPAERVARLERAARDEGSSGGDAWESLREALPTALGQGVADRRFRPGSWSPGDAWYHTRDVDRYAKALLPVVERALAAGRALDAELVREMVRAYSPRTFTSTRFGRRPSNSP
jgi:hypothetical protein